MSAIATAQTADREVGDLLRLLDHAAPAPDMTFLEARTLDFERARSVGTTERRSLIRNRRPPAAQQRPAASGPDAASSQRSTLAVSVRRGAVILALSAAAAAAAAPHSPVRQFIAHLISRPGNSEHAPVAPPVDATTRPAVAPASPRGVAIPASGRIDIAFRSPQAGSVVRILPALASQVSVTASADGPTYTVGSGTITVDAHETPGVTYDIQLPPVTTLPHVSVRVGTHVIFARDDNGVHTDGQPGADGAYVLPLGQ